MWWEKNFKNLRRLLLPPNAEAIFAIRSWSSWYCWHWEEGGEGATWYNHFGIAACRGIDNLTKPNRSNRKSVEDKISSFVLMFQLQVRIRMPLATLSLTSEIRECLVVRYGPRNTSKLKSNCNDGMCSYYLVLSTTPSAYWLWQLFVLHRIESRWFDSNPAAHRDIQYEWILDFQ